MMKRRHFIKNTSLGIVSVGMGISSAASSPVHSQQQKRESTAIASWDFLKPGDVIDVIAPSSPPHDPEKTFDRIKQYFEGSALSVNFPKNMIQPTPVLNEANTIEKRVDFIVKALLNPESKAIWAVLGGGWGVELLGMLKQRLDTLKLPFVKPILGYSDVTALHVFFNQYTHFTSLHCIELGASGDIEPAWNQSKIAPVLDVLTGKTPDVSYEVTLLNPDVMPKSDKVSTRIVGGNALLVSALKGSDDFTLDTKNKTLFIESVALGAGEISRILNGFRYSQMVRQADAVLLGNFVAKGGHPNLPHDEEQFTLVRQFFAKSVDIPVFFSTSFGHGPVNHPLPLNTHASFTLKDKDKALLKVSANKTDRFG
ncbi:MAG: LD-carboxypeptidase [Ostreibacterium sp.]